MNRKLLIAIAGLLLAAGVAVFFLTQSHVEPAEESSAVKSDDSQKKLVEDRGPRPTQTRLRDGAKQIEEPDKALRNAQEALDRINTEIARASDDETREKLEKKKVLIERMIERF